MKNICLVGVGPHSKRIYFKYFKDYNISPKCIVELKSKEQEVLNLLDEKNIQGCQLVLLDDKFKDDILLNKEYYNELKIVCKKLKIDSAIISTEPKAHNAYINFFLENKIPVVSDKPITVRKGMLNRKNIESIKKDFNSILKKSEKYNTPVQIMCQRLYHEGYNYIKNLVKETILKYNIPITFCEVYHCDGKWMMPHDLNGENHPYKYGYGKLYHSGYHFIQLLNEIMSLNDFVKDESKKIDKVELTSTFISPEDEATEINFQDYKNLFEGQEIPAFYNNPRKNYDKYGEKNSYSLITYKNKHNRTISVASLNLLQNGFSRRAWIKTNADEYKNNGRIRHEYLNLQIGTLMNIQVHSYQSKEIKDRTEFETETGGLEHFDIYIFRNCELIGGVPFEKITLDELIKKRNKDFIGFNESAREALLKDFLDGKTNVSDIKNHKRGINLLYNLTKLYKKYSKNHRQNYIKFSYN